MLTLKKSWLKIYLFYGVIFFLIGFCASLTSEETGVTFWLKKQNAQIRQFWLPPVAKEDAAVFSGQSPEIVLLDYSNALAPGKTTSFCRQLQGDLEKIFQKITIVPVSDLQQMDKLVGVMTPGEKPWIMVGIIEGNPWSKCFFSLPGPALSLSTDRIWSALFPKLPVLKMGKYSLKNATVIELNWPGAPSTDTGVGRVIREGLGPALSGLAGKMLE
ncbi:MAG: hypothetical protein ACM3X9_15185 [Bacillota bacterium]